MSSEVKKQLLRIYNYFSKIMGIYNLTRYVSKNADLKIIIGAEKTYQTGWISTQKSYLDMTNINHWKMFFREGNISTILAEHVFEHMEWEDAKKSLINSNKFLKPGGYFRIAVPDGFHPDPDYIDLVKVNGSGYGSDDHKILYNYQILSKLLEESGFSVKLLEFFDEHGHFHRINWDSLDGNIRRSSINDIRNKEKALKYTSLIVDAIKIE